MIEFLRKLFHADSGKNPSAPPVTHAQGQRGAAKRPASKAAPKTVEIEPRLSGRVVSNGPGKNVLIPSSHGEGRATDPGSGTVDKSEDELTFDTGDKAGIDPYNTGNFDRSKNWDKRYRK